MARLSPSWKLENENNDFKRIKYIQPWVKEKIPGGNFEQFVVQQISILCPDKTKHYLNQFQKNPIHLKLLMHKLFKIPAWYFLHG